jgi:hypothetical protein
VRFPSPNPGGAVWLFEPGSVVSGTLMLPPEVVAAINDRFTAGGDGSTSSEEMADLQRFFAICAERGLGLVGWS